MTLRRDGQFEVVAAAGVEDGFVGTQVPAASIENELRNADEWGVWRFVPHHRASIEALSYSHIPDVTPLEGEDAWHPLDLLAAPLHDDQGRLRGLLSVDIPDDGRLPSPAKMEVLTRYAGDFPAEAHQNAKIVDIVKSVLVFFDSLFLLVDREPALAQDASPPSPAPG